MSDDNPNTFHLNGETFGLFEDDSSFEEGEGMARQTDVEVFEVVGDSAHFSIVGFVVDRNSIIEATKIISAIEADLEIGVTYHRDDDAELPEILDLYYQQFPLISAITIHP